jgi:hypothetical protein
LNIVKTLWNPSFDVNASRTAIFPIGKRARIHIPLRDKQCRISSIKAFFSADPQHPLDQLRKRMNLTKVSRLVAATVATSLLYRQFALRDSFAHKVVVITGGSRGLGLALARRLAREQARLAILSRDEQELARAKSDLLKYCSVVTTWQCDIKDELFQRSVCCLSPLEPASDVGKVYLFPSSFEKFADSAHQRDC